MHPSPPGERGALDARAAALRYLARREYSRCELVRKLAARGVDEAHAATVVDSLAQEGLVSDERFTESFCRQRVERFQGPVKIRAELRARGVADAVIAAGLEAYAERWRDLAAEWVGRRASANPDRREKARLYRGGLNRGFSHEHVMAAIDRVQRRG